MRDVDNFQDLLRDLTTDRQKIKMVMGFALDHAEESRDVVEIISESLTITETPINKKLARLYALSDILYNSSAPVRNASSYRTLFQNHLEDVFQGLHEAYVNIHGRITANAMKEKVTQVMHVWEAWSLFPAGFVDRLELIFIGEDKTKKPKFMEEPCRLPAARPAGHAATTDKLSRPKKAAEEDIDGAPMQLLGGAYDSDEDDVDGVPMDNANAPVFGAFAKPVSDDEDLDGEPIDGAPLPTEGGGLQVSVSKMAMGDQEEEEDLDGEPLK